MAVKSFVALSTPARPFVRRAEAAGPEDGCCGAHLAGIIGPGEEEDDFPQILRSGGRACSCEEKADWPHILSVFVAVGPSSLFFVLILLLPLREEIFLSA